MNSKEIKKKKNIKNKICNVRVTVEKGNQYSVKRYGSSQVLSSPWMTHVCVSRTSQNTKFVNNKYFLRVNTKECFRLLTRL